MQCQCVFFLGGGLASLLWEAEYGLMLLIADILTLFLPYTPPNQNQKI